MSSKQWFSALLFAGVALSSAYAQQPPAAKPAPAPADFSKEAYVIEHVDTRIHEEDDGTGTREVTAEIRVLADAGVKAFAVLNFTYTSANETVDIDYVRVRKPDGTVVKTPDYNIQDMPADVTRTAPLYSDIHEKHVAVKGLGVGDVLEYLLRYRIVKPEVPGQFWQEYTFTKDAIAKDEELEISVPAAKYVKVVSPEFPPQISEQDGRKIYRWTHSNLVVKRQEPGEIPRRIPPNPDVQLTTFRSWEEVGRWYGDLQKEPLEVTAAIQKKADELTKGLKTDDEKIEAIYNFVALKFHYIGLDFGIGRYQPHAADDVLDNGYGDCKDKHTLLASLLKASGIDAWPVLIHATRKLDPDVPSPAQFNHVITVVPRGDKYVWLDTTPEVAPYGMLLLTLRDKQALVIPSNQPPVLMTTPAQASFMQMQSFSMEGKLSDDGHFSGHSEQSYHGDAEVIFRAVFRQVPESQWKEAAQRLSYGLNFMGDVSNVKMTQPDDLSKPFEISYDYERNHYSDWDNRQMTPPIPPLGGEMSSDSKKPPEPVVLGGLGEVVYRAKVTLPPGYTATAPQNVDLVRPYAEYHATYSIEKGVFSATRRFIIKKTEVELSIWEDYRDFGKAISDDENKYTHLNGTGASTGATAGASAGNLDEQFRLGTTALQQRDFQQAQELFEAIIAKDPNYKGAHFNLAITLLSRRDVSKAIDEFRREEKVSPENTAAYQAAATYLTSAGRRDDAIEEWRKLLKIDPGNRTGAANLAGLLFQAERYPEAVAALEAAVKLAPESAGLQFQLGQAYLKTKEDEKAIAIFQKTVEQKSDDPDTLNNVAHSLAENNLRLDLAQQYAETAVKQLEAESVKDVADADAGARVALQLSMTWDTLGWVYFLNGDTNRSEGYVRAAWLLGLHAVVGEHLGEIYEKEGKKKAAAHTYELALAANGGKSLEDEITSRYQKLTGTKPETRETFRLPNGQWTKSAVEEFQDMRTVKLGKQPNLSGGGEFSIVFAPGGVESVEYQSGQQSLKALTEKIKGANYEVEFPAGSQARIRRRAMANCSAITGCMIVFVPLQAPRTPPNYFPTY